MKTSKAFAWILVVTLSLGFVLSGCSGQGKVKLNPKNPTEIKIWHYYNDTQKAAFDKLIAEFNETAGKEIGIVATSENQGSVNQLLDGVLESAQNKVGTDAIPNIFFGYADTVHTVDKLGLVVGLDKYFSDKELSNYVDAYIEEGRIGESQELKIFPTAKSTELLMINKTFWEQFSQASGVSIDKLETMEGLTETAREYYKWTDGLTPNVPDDGKAFYGRDGLANYIIIGCNQLGAEIFQVDKTGKVTFNIDDAAMRRMWDNYYTPYINGWFLDKGKFSSDDLKVGDIVAYVGSSSSSKYFPKVVTINDTEQYDVEPIIMAPPVFEGGEKYAVQQGAGMVVTTATKEQEYASVEFLKWFTDADRNLKFAIDASYLPVRKDSNDKERLAKIMEAAPDSEEYYTDITKDAIEVGIDVANQYTLYTNKAFDNGYEARKVLESSMKDRLKQDMEQVEVLVQGGMTRKEAVSKYDNDENFNAWIAQFKTELEATQK